MACTYDYDTGKITLDFHLVKYDEICELRGIKGRVGVDEHIQTTNGLCL